MVSTENNECETRQEKVGRCGVIVGTIVPCCWVVRLKSRYRRHLGISKFQRVTISK